MPRRVVVASSIHIFGWILRPDEEEGNLETCFAQPMRYDNNNKY